MVSLPSLYVLAAALWTGAAAVAWLRGRPLRAAAADGCAASGGAAVALALAVLLFAVAGREGAVETWRQAARWMLLASPLGATFGLALRRRGGAPRTLLGGAAALAGVVLWLTLALRGPRGGWPAATVALVALAAALAVGGGACLGRWSRRPAPGGGSRLPARALTLGLSAPLLAALLASAACRVGDGSATPPGSLELTVVDAATGRPTPARVELLDPGGAALIADDALAVFADCGQPPIDAWVPGAAALQAIASRRREIWNPYTETRQFYAAGTVHARLPADRYTVRATKGPEYLAASAHVLVEPGRPTRLELELERWIDLGAEGWYSADDHLHIPRPHPRFDPELATWLEAEGLAVGNFLQMGLARDVHITPQQGFGPRSAFRHGDTLLLSGQENPRTHVLGHTIVLGARRYLDLPADYLLYDRVWREAHRHGAVNGYAHWGLGGAEEGLALWGHAALLDFLEVLNLGFPFYDRWYEALDLGLRIGPTAGTDYPCLPSLPGRERFYARTEGELTAESWLAAVRRGATFVTNGPALDLAVGEAGPGDELRLAASGRVRVRGRVRFDPARDAVAALELIRAGAVALRVEARPGAAEVLLETDLEVDRTTWLALRAAGVKRGESPIDLHAMFSTMLVLDRPSNEALLAALPRGSVPRPSAAHTGAVFVTVAGTPPLAEQDRAREVARLWLDRLHTLEGRLADGQIESWARFPGRGDGVDLPTARANRALLLQAIEAARRHHEAATRP